MEATYWRSFGRRTRRPAADRKSRVGRSSSPLLGTANRIEKSLLSLIISSFVIQNRFYCIGKRQSLFGAGGHVFQAQQAGGKLVGAGDDYEWDVLSVGILQVTGDAAAAHVKFHPQAGFA